MRLFSNMDSIFEREHNKCKTIVSNTYNTNWSHFTNATLLQLIIEHGYCNKLNVYHNRNSTSAATYLLPSKQNIRTLKIILLSFFNCKRISTGYNKNCSFVCFTCSRFIPNRMNFLQT